MQLHYYAFSFFDSDDDGKNWGAANCYLGLSEQQITIGDIAQARRGAEVGPDAVLLAATYLGLMTAEEFKNA